MYVCVQIRSLVSGRFKFEHIAHNTNLDILRAQLAAVKEIKIVECLVL